MLTRTNLQKVSSLQEAAAALVARVLLLRGVAQAVASQAAQLGVAGAAVLTGVGLLARVHPLVNLHVDLLAEAFAAHAAGVRLLAKVRRYVVGEARRAREVALAQRAVVPPLGRRRHRHRDVACRKKHTRRDVRASHLVSIPQSVIGQVWLPLLVCKRIWRPFQGVVRLSPEVIWDRRQHPTTLNLGCGIENGWTD